MKVSLRFRQLIEEFPTVATLAAHLLLSERPEKLVDRHGGARWNEPSPAKAFGAGARINNSVDQRSHAPAASGARRSGRPLYRAHRQEPRVRRRAPTHLADPRAVSGFRPLWKDLVYPIVSATSKGPRFTDIDGNTTWTSPTVRFGVLRPSTGLLVDAVHEQIDQRHHHRPAESARRRMRQAVRGDDRAMSGSRSATPVPRRCWLIRLAAPSPAAISSCSTRAITTASPTGAGRGTAGGRTVPAAPASRRRAWPTPSSSSTARPASLEVLRDGQHELAAVVIEPVQSRKPDLQPADYVREVRRICDESGTA